ncbi:MAG: adenine-specific methyltransferase EcoRI family protein [Patescibacteria group bacterium]|jgi:hypothetical protein
MTRSQNTNLHRARDRKNDEFYTQLSDIEKELKYYKDHFRGKIIYCNADDPFESNFFKYFASNFNNLGLKKLITTSYAGSPVVGEQLPLFEVAGLKKAKIKEPMKIEINEVKDLNKDGATSIIDVELLLRNNKNITTPLKGDGDFRSEECIKLLKEADIIVTNPPFSLFREYVAQLMEYKKKFLIIGNKNAITYKEFFPLLKDNKVWIGYNNVKEFKQPNGVLKKFGNVGWYTNLDIKKRHEELILYKKYNSKEYPKYDNYDAINVDKVNNIPSDYDGVMGVPITFMDKYNPNQFEIVSFRKGSDGKDLVFTRERERVQPYFRILVRRQFRD